MPFKPLFTATMLLLMAISSVSAHWKGVWSDEFDYTGLPDTTKWGYDVGTGSNGWGNNELEYYTRDSLKNARVEKGTLIITALKETIGNSGYTSARLVTKNRGDWLYGRFEIAAKLPAGTGLWPAIWMLPTDGEYGGWPKSGELDIMENVGFDPYRIHFNIHTEAYNHSIGTNKGNSIMLDNPQTEFNTYALEWHEDSVVFFANDLVTFTFKNENTGSAVWPFDKRFHLLLNIAVGGSWGGQQGVDDASFPAEMVIDYVRVYEYSAMNVGSNAPESDAFDHTPLSCNKGVLRVHHREVSEVKVYDARGRCVAGITGNTILVADNGIQLLLPQGAYVAVVHYRGGNASQTLLIVR